MTHILLVEPDHYSKFPPMGLLRLSTFHKGLGHTTELVKGMVKPEHKPDCIYITTLFTWSWPIVWETVKAYKMLFPKIQIHLGGVYASLLPDHARRSGADHVHEGLQKELEDLEPDYSLVPDWRTSLIYSSRGCFRNCGFCAVPRLEGQMINKTSILDQVYPSHQRIYIMDNNFLANPHHELILEELIGLDLPVDFNQGLDARLITPQVAKIVTSLKIPIIHFAYDDPSYRLQVALAIEWLGQYRAKRNFVIYALYNYNNPPEEFFSRTRNILTWGSTVYPMRYEPVNTLKKGSFISREWTSEKIEMIIDFQRAIGFRGVIPPLKGIVDRFEKAKSFEEAFSIED